MAHFAILAYIDPMSGSIILQVILAGILACLALFRNQVRRVVAWVTGRKSEPGVQATTQGTEPPSESPQKIRKSA